LAVIVEDPADITVEGFAEQLFMVGGSNGLTVNWAEQSADWPGFVPSATWPATVYVPGAAAFVSMFAVAEVPEIVPPVEVHV
jgi:hypothetical protein